MATSEPTSHDRGSRRNVGPGRSSFAADDRIVDDGTTQTARSDRTGEEQAS
jgi:hypothetical protein